MQLFHLIVAYLRLFSKFLKEFYGFSGVIWGVILGERDYNSPRFKVKKFFPTADT